MTGRIHKKAVISLLSTNITTGKPFTGNDLIRTIKEKNIFHKDNIPGTNTYKIHGLDLQLLATKMIDFAVSTTAKLGSTKLRSKYVHIIIPNSQENGLVLPSYMIDSIWDSINTV